MAQVVSTWGTRIRAILHDSIGKVCPGIVKHGASNLATDYDEQIHVPHVLKNMDHPDSAAIKPMAGTAMTALWRRMSAVP